MRKGLPRGTHFLIALSLLAVAAPSFALAESDADGYPPGRFEHSPLIAVQLSKHSQQSQKAL
jgi:hypothetical protein